MLLIPALGKQKQVDLSEFEASMVYRASSRTARTVTQRNHVLERKQNTPVFWHNPCGGRWRQVELSGQPA